MGHQYAGAAGTFAVDYTIPDDGDAEAAISVNVALQALGDRTQYIVQRAIPRVDVLNAASGTWTCPPNVTLIELQSYGGGGGGASGGGGDLTTPTTRCALGGGGGGGSRRTITRMVVVPGTVYPYVNGAGGASGAPGGNFSGGPGTPGGDGGDATFNGTVVSRGGGGGSAATSPATVLANYSYNTYGGRSPRSVSAPGVANVIVSSSTIFSVCQDGGNGGAGAVGVGPRAADGGCSPEGFAGGAFGASGATNTNLGGGGGGGGGAGPGGVGGAGGAGGAGGPSSGVAGFSGVAAATGSGAGGGGGGAGGQGSSVAAGYGANGAAGGSGQIAIVYQGSQAVFT